MVFHKWKTIFVGIAKNASMSIFHTLINPSDNQCTSHNHNTIVEDLNEGDESLLNTYFSFAICRNPYDRFFSAWKHNNPHPGPTEAMAYINNFNSWVKDFSGQDRMIDLKKHPHLIQRYFDTMCLLEANPYHNSLRFHKLRGKLNS